MINFDQLELNSIGISVKCHTVVSRTLQGNFRFFEERKTGKSYKKPQSKDENQPLKSPRNDTRLR